MSLFDDLITYELCEELLTVPVDDPMGQDTFQCCECSGNFDVDWAEETVTPWLQLELTVDVEDEPCFFCEVLLLALT